MGNRANLILKKNNSESKLVFEANNHLPFFWLMLLDIDTIEKNESKFIDCFENQTENCDGIFTIDKNTFEENSKLAKAYLKKFYPELSSKFKQFYKYINHIISKDYIALDIIEITNFYDSSTEFLSEIKKTIFAIQKMILLDEKDASEYIANTNYFYLVGFDTYVNVAVKFSEFSKEYQQLQQNIIDKRNKQLKKGSELKKNESRRNKKKVFYGIILIFMGLFSLIVQFFLILYDDKVAIGKIIVGIIFSLLFLFFGYSKLKKTAQK